MILSRLYERWMSTFNCEFLNPIHIHAAGSEASAIKSGFKIYYEQRTSLGIIFYLEFQLIQLNKKNFI
jgi:hypothetical protein